jgi:1,2-phenylacetyl-CoA epoxidase PaaB subunit
VKQAKQVFYVKDPANKKLYVILFGKRHIVRMENVADELEYDHFDEIPPFSIGIDPVPVDDSAERVFARTNHEDGLWVKKKSKRKKN